MTGDEVRAIREALGLTQKELASYLGYAGETSVTHIEAGRQKVVGPVRRLLEILRDSEGGALSAEWAKQKKRKKKRERT